MQTHELNVEINCMDIVYQVKHIAYIHQFLLNFSFELHLIHYRDGDRDDSFLIHLLTFLYLKKNKKKTKIVPKIQPKIEKYIIVFFACLDWC